MILDFYLELFDSKEFEYSGKTVWFRDSYYNALITEYVPNAETKELEPVQRQRKEYLYQEWSKKSKNNFTPPQSGDILYGIELKIKGDCPLLYLSEEEGFQLWTLDADTKQKYYVRVSGGQVTKAGCKTFQ